MATSTTTPWEEVLGSRNWDTVLDPFDQSCEFLQSCEFIYVQAMLHVVTGWNEKIGEFKLMVKRSIALVNKSCEFLKDECFKLEKNKGMIKDENGEWVIAAVEEEPEPEF